MKAGRFHRKIRPHLNLTQPVNRSSLILYHVEPSPFRPPGAGPAKAFRAGPTKSHHSDIGGSGIGGWVPDTSCRSPQRGGGDAGHRLLRAVSDRHRIIVKV